MGRKGVFCLTARLEFTIRIILITLLFVCGVMANSLIISGFETIQDLQRWRVSVTTPPSSLERVKEHATEGEYSARFSVPKYQQGGEKWPFMRLSGASFPRNWSKYSQLSIDFYNPSSYESKLPFKIRITDINGNQNKATVKLRKEGPGNVTIDFRSSEVIIQDAEGSYISGIQGGNFDFSNVVNLYIYFSEPPENATVYLDNIKLVDTSEEILTELVERWKDICESNSQSLKNTPDLFDNWKKIGNIIDSDLESWRKIQLVEEHLDILEFKYTLNMLLAESKKVYPNLPFGIAWADSMVKIFPKVEIPDVEITEKFKLELAKNEYESCQLVIIAPTTKEVNSVSIKPDKFVSENGVAFDGEILVAPVGFVKKKENKYPFFKWYPDPILSFLDKTDILPGEVQPFWVTVKTNDKTPAGSYMGNFIVEATFEGKVVKSLVPFEFQVWNFAVPKERHLPTVVGTGVYNVCSETMRDRIYDLLVEYRINPDNIYRKIDPNNRRDGGFPSVEQLLKWKEKGINKINLASVNRSTNLQKLFAWLDGIVPILKENDLYDIAYLYGFDEIPLNEIPEMIDIVTKIKERYPDLFFLTTAYDYTYGLTTDPNGIIDGWCPQTRRYDLEAVERAREQGRQVWWYIALARPPYASFLLENPTIDGRLLMGFHASYFKPDGFLYYRVNRWQNNDSPIVSGPYTTWNPASHNEGDGSGSLLCAGPDEKPLSTIRFENIRDGLEDYEYYWILETCVENANNKGIKDDLINRAISALEFDEYFISSISEFSRDPVDVRKKRRELANLIELFIAEGITY